MSNFSTPADNLVHESVGYVNAQLDNVKLRTVKGLSQGTSSIAKLLIIFVLVGALVTMLSFAIVLLVGELIGSYAGAAFIMSGILLVAIILIIALRHRIFKDSFIGMYTDIFYQHDTRPLGLDSHEDLDEAIRRAEMKIQSQETNVSGAYDKVKEYYAPRNLFNRGLEWAGFCNGRGDINWGNLIIKAITFLFNKKDQKQKES